MPDRFARAAAGRAARDSGADFEAFVERHHAEALRLGVLAHVAHNEPHGRMVGGRWVMVAPGVADYTGVIFPRGRVLAVEAKSRRGRIRLGDVEPAQRRHLDAVVRGGGLAILLVRIVESTAAAEFQSEYAVPWVDVPWRVVRSAESVGAEDLATWVIPSDRRCYLEPFCPDRGAPAPGRRFQKGGDK